MGTADNAEDTDSKVLMTASLPSVVESLFFQHSCSFVKFVVPHSFPHSTAMKTIFFVLSSLLVSATITCAAIRHSASYQSLAENAQPGRARLRSATFTADTAVSPLGGIASSARFTARFGHAGQLYDVTGGTLTATPSPVPETATAQLGVSATLDDGTALPSASAHVSAWQIVSGPLVAITADGLATADAVWTDTPATVRATLQGGVIEGAFTIANTLSDNFGPVANDGLDDAWQFAQFDTNGDGSLDLPAGPTDDPDADGATNLAEWLAGTDPVNAADLLRLEALGLSDDGFRLRFGPLLPSRRYLLFARPDFTAVPHPIFTLDPIEPAAWHEHTVPLSATPDAFFHLGVEVE